MNKQIIQHISNQTDDDDDGDDDDDDDDDDDVMYSDLPSLL